MVFDKIATGNYLLRRLFTMCNLEILKTAYHGLTVPWWGRGSESDEAAGRVVRRGVVQF